MPRLWLTPLGLILLLFLAAAAPVPEIGPGAGPGPGIGAVTKLPVPRFVSLRSAQVNFRAGPGFQYPVTWVYQRAGLPVEIIGEFNEWRQLVAPDGGTGWVHEATLRARRGFYVAAPQVVLRSAPDAGAAVTAYLNQGVSGELIRCDKAADFCKVSVDQRSGYLARADFWGIFDGETVAP